MSKPETVSRSSVPVEQLLRPQTRVDLIFDVNLVSGYIDVRRSVILDFVSGRVIIGQADPPVLSSLVGKSMEATFVRRDPVTSEIKRWGWRSQVLELIPRYQVRADNPETLPALAISPPAEGGLSESNARMDYRLTISGDKKISIQTHPSFGRITLLDFSAGGVLIGVPKPAQIQPGFKLWFTLFFPFQSVPGQPTAITGEAEVVRVTVEDDEPFARMGLKFLNLDFTATRALQKTINFYMLEEQRQRPRLTFTASQAEPES
jgi:hypothetical protein